MRGTAAAATDAAIHKKMFGSGTATLIILNKEMNDIMKIIKSLEESGLLTKEQKGGFFRMFLGILDATLFNKSISS